MEFSGLSLADSRIAQGCVHGRFQPFHNDHLSYVLAASSRCEFLWIGITKYDTMPAELNPLARHRERPENNPLTYFERISIIGEALDDRGVARRNFGFVPFPIDTPLRLPAFMPLSVPCFTTICEEWNREKIRVLESHGYKVLVLWEREKKAVTGSEVRGDILSGGMAWKGMVPEATARAIESLDIRRRLLQLKTGGMPGNAASVPGDK